MAAGIEWPTLAALIIIATFLLALLKVASNLADRLTAAKAKADAAMIVANEANTRAERAERGLAEFREEVARTYVTSDAIERVEQRLVLAIERLGDRLDRVLDGRSGKGSA